jgi:predicted phage terminase large subunit-like protein
VVPVVVAAPRGFAKTTVVSFGYVLHQVLFERRRFVVIGSDTADLASDLTAYIQIELLHNERIRADFGELVRDGEAVDDFVTANGVRILARGRGQRLRGIKHGAYRPDLVVLDDLENDTNVRNPRLVRALLDWILKAVYGAVDPAGSLFIIGTKLAPRSALAIMVEGKEEPFDSWTRRLYRALEEGPKGEWRSLWPARHPVENLLKRRKIMGEPAFQAELQNNPRDDQSIFSQEWIDGHAFRMADLPRGVVVVGFLDPSISQRASADYKAVVAVAQSDEATYVVDAYVRRESLDRVLRHIFAMHLDWNFAAFGVESNLFQALLIRDFDRLSRELGGYLPVRGVHHATAKEARISALSPLVERGLLRFPVPGDRTEDMRRLVEQLICFPSPTVHDDGPDALEGAVSLLRDLSAMWPTGVMPAGRAAR